MSTINPYALTVVTAVQPTGGGTHDAVTLASCYDCGSLIVNAEAHRTACPRLMPPKPEPLEYDQHAIAQVMRGHEPVTLADTASVGCACNPHARFADYHAWCGHVANAIATTLGGAR